ncbi:hypothetical protein [Larkinella soli]|uniref:hypothetical protein n=1 Tax=Larkinella soli TaxID=1770527 RepID=UPI000FFB4ACA|nr:hypothetical protein [Larkinella soli]
MRKTFISVLLAGAVFVNACKNKQQTADASGADTTEVLADRQSPGQEVVLSDRLKTLLKSDEGLFRGVNLGDEISAVKEKETAEAFESDNDHLGYTIEYRNLESADIQYFQDKDRRVSRIEVDLYLNNRQSVDSFRKELGAYFDQKFGQGTPQGWTAGNNARITLTDVSKGKDFGLKLRFNLAGGAVTARK